MYAKITQHTSKPARPSARLQIFHVLTFSADRPLGMVDIPLGHLNANGEEWEQYYSLEPFGILRAGGRLGSVQLRLKIGPVVGKRDASSKIFADLKRGLDDRGDEEPEDSELPPNFLRIKLHQVWRLGPGQVVACLVPPCHRMSTDFRVLSNYLFVLYGLFGGDVAAAVAAAVALVEAGFCACAFACGYCTINRQVD